MAEQVKSTAVTMKNLVTERKRLLAIPKRERTSIEKVDLIKVDRQISEMNRAKIRRQKLGSNKPPVASQLDQQQGNVPEPAVKTGPRGKIVTEKVTEADDFKGVSKPKREETWKETQARLVKKLKVDPRKIGPTASRADPDSAQYAAAIKAKAKKAEQKRKAEREGLEEMEEGIRVGELRSEKGRKKFKSPKDYQVGYRDFGSKDAPGTKVNISSADKDVTQKVAKRAVNEVFEGTTGKFGTIAGKKAIKGFFSDVLGIDDITVTYDAPGQGDDQMEFYGKKKGGKVTAKRSPTKKAAAKRPTTKKYAMNRGGKVASVRKPTRA
jgi:hypothetical protein